MSHLRPDLAAMLAELGAAYLEARERTHIRRGGERRRIVAAIVALGRSHGLTQAETAGAMGLSQSYVARLDAPPPPIAPAKPVSRDLGAERFVRVCSVHLVPVRFVDRSHGGGSAESPVCPEGHLLARWGVWDQKRRCMVAGASVERVVLAFDVETAWTFSHAITPAYRDIVEVA